VVYVELGGFERVNPIFVMSSNCTLDLAAIHVISLECTIPYLQRRNETFLGYSEVYVTFEYNACGNQYMIAIVIGGIVGVLFAAFLVALWCFEDKRKKGS